MARLSPRARLWWLVSAFVAFGFVMTALMTLALTEYREQLVEPGFQHIDQQALISAHAMASPPLTIVMMALTTLGSPYTLLAVSVVFVALALVRRKWRWAVVMLVTITGATALTFMFKWWFQRPRPAMAWSLAGEPGFGFPSGHSMVGLAVYGLLAYVLVRATSSGKARILILVGAVALVASIGFSRIYLGVHYLSDVVAGFGAGVIWLGTVIVMAEIVRVAYPSQAQTTPRLPASDRTPDGTAGGAT